MRNKTGMREGESRDLIQLQLPYLQVKGTFGDNVNKWEDDCVSVLLGIYVK